MKRWTRHNVAILAGFSSRISYYLEPVVCHEEHEFNVALSGEGVYRLAGDQMVRLAAGEILLLPGGVPHGIEVQRHLRMAVIHFHPEVLQTLAVPVTKRLLSTRHPLPPRKLVDPDAHATLERLAEDAVVEQNRPGLGRDALLQSLATQAAVYFLRLMTREMPLDAPDETTRRILTVRNWLDRHFDEPCSLTSLSEMAHLAPTYFAARFRQVVGVPPMTYVRDRRLEQARQLLERTRQPVKLVAWSVGFTDVSYFYRVFRQATGSTPIEYRQRTRAAARRA